MNDLILLHGALGSAEDMQMLTPHLQYPHLNLHSLTFSGHGQRDCNGAFGIEAFSDELIAFVSAKQLTQPFVFGYSMGGYVALNAALKHTHLFSGIITLGTKFDWSNDFTTRETAKLKQDVLLEKAPAFVASLLQKHGRGWPQLLSLTSEMLHTIQLTHREFIAKLPQLSLPINIGRAALDKMVTKEECFWILQTLTNASYFELAESSHGFETINHAAMAQHLLEFIAHHSPNAKPANDSHQV